MTGASRAWPGEIVGHRGAAGLAPENTLEGFAAAVAAGVDRIELDVRRTSDRRVVVFHDFKLDRLHPDADGRIGRTVSRCTLAQMREIDVGAALGRPGCHVPSLDETLDAFGSRVPLNVEVKGSGADGLLALQLTADLVRERRLEEAVLLSSSHPSVLRRAQVSVGEIDRALIVSRKSSGDPIAVATGMACRAIHPEQSLVSDALLARCREAGLAVRPWTVNEEAEMRRLVDRGVDGIVTDRPDVLARLLGRGRSSAGTMPP